MDTLPQWEQLLSKRGILGVAKEFGWGPTNYSGESGWVYPVFNELDEHIATRFKNFNSNPEKFKYAWPAGQPEDCKYYLLPGAVAEMGRTGKCVLASGEPDVLAYRAAGCKNVLCWFGEKAVPATLAADLQSFGVHFVELAPDRDSAGMSWAQCIVNAIGGTGIGWRVYELDAPMDSKYDINRLWAECKFDLDCFWDSLIRCNELEVKPVELKPENLPLIRDNHGERDYPPEFYSAIERALNVTKYKANGFSEPVRCPLHDDEHASAGWDREKHILKCFVCHGDNEFALAKDVAAKLGIRPEAFYPPRPVTVKPAAPNAVPAGKPQILRTWDEGTDRLIAQINGDVPIFDPLPLPFQRLRALGGFAKHTGPGKMIAIVADTGMGKTSWIETVVDAWRRAGFSGVIWGPEWSHSEYVQRAIQRSGGPTYEQVEDHKAYLSELKRGVPERHRIGKLLDQQQKDLLVEKADNMKAWPGKLMFVEKMNLPIEAVIKNMLEASDRYTADGKRLSFAVLDYAQLVAAPGENDSARMGHVLNAFKRYVVDRQLVGIVGSQTTKSDGRMAAAGTKGSLHAPLSARLDDFNLALVLTRTVDEEGVLSQQANCRVVKNSAGAVGDIPLWLNTERLTWHDMETKPLNLDLPPVPVHGMTDY